MPNLTRKYKRGSRQTRRRRAVLKPLNIATKKSSTAQSKQIRALAKETKHLKKMVKDNRKWAQYELNSGNTALVNGQWHVTTLINPTEWNPRFQANDAIAENTKVNLHSIDVQLYYRPTDSLVPLTAKMVTVYLLKLRRETALQTLEDSAQMTSVGWNDTTNPMNTKYWNTQNIGLSYEALPQLNNGAFKVLGKREFQVQNIIQNTAATSVTTEEAPDVAVTTPQGTFKRCHFHIKVNNLIKSGIQENWKQMGSGDIMPHDRYYIVTHVGGNGNEDTLEDGNGVSQGINALITLRSTQ